MLISETPAEKRLGGGGDQIWHNILKLKYIPENYQKPTKPTAARQEPG